MKKLIQVLSVFAIAGLAMTAAPQAKAEISAGQARAVLRSIDVTCGDTWCESDYNFHFTDFVCDPVTKICKIVFFMDQNEPLKLVGGDGYSGTFKSTAAKGTCSFSGISDVSDMVDAQQQLNGKFYNLVSNCLSNMISQAAAASSKAGN